MAQSEQVLSHTICRNLSDRSYEKRKQGALAIEQLVRQLNNAALLEEEEEEGDEAKAKQKQKAKAQPGKISGRTQIGLTINFLVATFIRSTQANHRKGGLIGL